MTACLPVYIPELQIALQARHILKPDPFFPFLLITFWWRGSRFTSNCSLHRIRLKENTTSRSLHWGGERLPCKPEIFWLSTISNLKVLQMMNMSRMQEKTLRTNFLLLWNLLCDAGVKHKVLNANSNQVLKPYWVFKLIFCCLWPCWFCFLFHC